MIQRIQSLYLLIGFLATLILYFLNLGFIKSDDGAWTYHVCYLSLQDGTVHSILWMNAVVVAMVALLQLVTILMFNNRNRQMKFARITLLGTVLMTASVLFTPDLITSHFPEHEMTVTFSWTAYLVLIPIVTTFLAVRFIKKDIELVSAADRIR